MIYVVTGFMRSFTTMMMHCLEAGGMEPVWDSDRDEWAGRHGEVNPRNELREINTNTLEHFMVNPQAYDGKLVKILSKYGYLELPPAEYRVLLLTRKPEEIRQSFKRVFGKEPVFSDAAGDQPLTDDLYYWLMSETAKGLMRPDIHLSVLKGEQVLENPKAAFAVLKDRGWPIEVDAAAAVVQPEHRHVHV